jgi:hypothetical protein
VISFDACRDTISACRLLAENDRARYKKNNLKCFDMIFLLKMAALEFHHASRDISELDKQSPNCH